MRHEQEPRLNYYSTMCIFMEQSTKNHRIEKQGSYSETKGGVEILISG